MKKSKTLGITGRNDGHDDTFEHLEDSVEPELKNHGLERRHQAVQRQQRAEVKVRVVLKPARVRCETPAPYYVTWRQSRGTSMEALY